MASVINIKNRYTRRLLLLLLVVPIGMYCVIYMTISGFFKGLEEIASAFYGAWHGRQ
jgi:hypothetical protein